MDCEMMECIVGNMVMKKCCDVHALRITVGITMLALLLVGSANASNLTVCPKGCEYSSIQKAIKASSNGDTILVQSGTYFENVNVNKQLILHGIGNPVVDAGGSGSVITLAANGITLEGFTATGSASYKTGIKVTSNNNTLTGNKASNNWYGISLFDSNKNTVTGNDASNNNYGISLSSSSNNTLNGNYYTGDNGISLSDSSNNTLTGNKESNNYYSSSGISLSHSSKNTLRDNMMTNFNLDGDTDSDFDNHIDTSNLVDGKPIYYLTKVSDATYDSSSNAGTFYCISCVNVTIKNLNLNNNGKGIYFWNTSQSRIQDINASNNRYIYYGSGIFLDNSNNNTLTGNNASNNYYGIWLFSSNNNTLTGNNALNNGYGIWLSSANNNILTGNNASNNYDGGISLSDSNRNTLIGNDASNNNYGISLSHSSKNTLSDNTMTNFNLDGDTDSDFNNYIDTSKLVDSRPIYYITKVSDTTSSSSNAGTFYCISCVNVTIKNLNLNNNGYGIYFWNTSQSRIQNVRASNNGYGIYLSTSCKNTLTGNKASNNYGGGISLSYSSNNLLNGNKASNNINYYSGDSGISLSSSSNNTLSGNKASNNGNYYSGGSGISLSSSSNNTLTGNKASNNGNYYNGSGISLSSSSNNTLSGNNASNNVYSGISLSSSNNNTLTGNNVSNNYFNFYGVGISLSSSSNNTLTGNNVLNNRNYYGSLGISLSSSSNNTLTDNNASINWKGIYLEYSSYNTLTGNNESNNIFGISVWYSSKNNTIYNNIFNNTNNFDFHDNKINTWNTTRQSVTNIIGGSFLGGNFWANPNGTGFSQTCKDVNGDGICDKSYTLDAKDIDYLPLAKDKTPPKSVRNLKNVSYAPSYINWTWKDPKDIDFKKVMVFIDGKFMKNISKGKRFYNATNFESNTKHTISTRTVDMIGNINKTWTNHSAWTAK